MSTSHPPTDSEDPPALGSRQNWWFQETQHDNPDAGGHDELSGTDPAEHIAFRHLRNLLDPVCSRQLHAPSWNGGRLAEAIAYVFDDDQIDGHEAELHHEQREQPLTGPAFHLPKQTEWGGRLLEYRQYPHRRRYNPDTGYINWGETTTTALPSFGEDIYDRAVHNYLADRGVRVTHLDDYLEHADRVWHDPELDAVESMVHLVSYVRDNEPGPHH